MDKRRSAGGHRQDAARRTGGHQQIAERRVKAMLPLRPADLQILLILGGGPLHAYGISKAAEEDRDGGVSLEIGSLYRTLNRLATDGLIEEAPIQERGPQGQERRTWQISRFGRAVARAEAERLRRVLESARAGRFLSGARGG